MGVPVRIGLCSALTVETADGVLTGHELGSRKARTLLALLASERGSAVPVDRVALALWPDAAPADPAANVATLVSRTRRLLGQDLVVARGRTYAIAGSRCLVDLDEATALLDEGRDRAAAGETALAAAAARRALALLGTATALPDEDDVDWVLAVRREAVGLRRRARHLLSAAVLATDPAEASAAATLAVADDAYDERAVRDLMRARAADGAGAAALAAYDDLARLLREELGTEPEQRTRALHLALLRGKAPPDEAPVRARPRTAALVGREPEMRALDHHWAAVVAGSGALVLLVGQAGMGKTRLLAAAADVAATSGGIVLRSRCRPSERSLFLQPFVDALRPVLLAMGESELHDLLRGHRDGLVGLLPDLADLVHVVPVPARDPVAERRRSFDAVVSVLRRLSVRQPVALLVDDLQEAGTASTDLLGHLAARLADARVLLLGALRQDAADVLDRLVEAADVVPVDVLPSTAVAALASEAGLDRRADEVLARTAGHALSVVECLRALAAGDDGVPASLAAAVAARVARLPAPVREVVEGASVLAGPVGPGLLARLLAGDEVTTARRCEELVRVGLLHRSGRGYEFVNDLIQECVSSGLPPAVAAAYHRRAADLSVGRPETMAGHAYAAGEPERAAEGWLLAGREALRRSAVDDATALLDQALSAATGAGLQARVLLARARTHEARTAFAAALADVEQALLLARATGDRRLEMAALRAHGGDVTVALGRPPSTVVASLEAGLALASGLGDRRAESDFSGRLAMLESSALRFGPALARARRNLAHCRAGSSEDALVLALDGVKTVLAHLGSVDELEAVVEELEPMLRRRKGTWLLQWTVFESSFVAAGRGSWVGAVTLVDEAVELNRRSGYSAYAGWFHANAAWFDRLAGDLDAALERGSRAVGETARADHPWWHAAAAGLHAGTLLEAGRTDEAAVVARRGLDLTGPGQADAWRLRCLAPLAAATGDARVRDEATALVRSIDAPPGGAWITGADTYLLAARSWQDDAPDRGPALLAPLVAATTTTWAVLHARALAAAQRSSATS